MIELMHAAWLAKKIIELACSGTLAQAAQDYTLELNRASRELGPKGTGRRSPSFSDRERQLRAEFLEAARREMGYAEWWYITLFEHRLNMRTARLMSAASPRR